MNQTKSNPLGTQPVAGLMVRFAIPSIIAMLVSALYNIADQLFIGQAIGILGNAATNIAFPLAMSCTALALLFGIGGASCFNLTLGRGDPDRAIYYVGNAVVGLVTGGLLLMLVVELFLKQILVAFGSPADVLPYAASYVRVLAIGFPFLILTIGGGHLIRADGSPRMAMLCTLSGAVINIGLDAVFIFGLRMGMTGAALATIIGQIFSAMLVIRYMRHYKTVPLKAMHFRPDPACLKMIVSIGAASFTNQIAMMIVQVVLNNSLKYYGLLSVYGDSIPIACAGIGTKCNQVFFSVVIGLAQGTQPIESFNYGARQYGRVRAAYRLALTAGFCVSMTSFVLFQLFPRPILSLFGGGEEAYYRFGASYFRIFLFFTGINCLQPITSTFFTSIGKAKYGMFLSLTRQILFLLPLVLILPRFMGITGILYAGPVADGAAAVTAVVMARREFGLMRQKEKSAPLKDALG